MNNENKLYELVEKIYIEMQDMKKEITDFREETNNRFGKLESKVDDIANKIDDLEVNNANRHLYINGELKRIKAGLSKVEIVTADNWSDIAKLKTKKRYITK